jgi:RND superfamily putative drug exporter
VPDRTPNTTGFGRVARAHAWVSITLRWPILIAWAVLVAVLLHDGVPSFGRDGLTLRELAPTDAPELATELEAARLFRVPLTARAQVVRRDADGLPLRVQRADVETAIDQSRDALEGSSARGAIAFQLPYVNTFGAFPASSESSTTTVLNLVGFPDSTLHARERAAHEIAAEERERSDAGRVSVTGGIPAQLETGRIIRANLDTLQLASILVLVLITAVWFRALVPPLVVVATIGTTMLLLLEALAAASERFDVTVPAEVLPVVLVVAIGIATDYALFPMTAWRRGVLSGTDPRDAVHDSICGTSPVVLTAGITTALGATSLHVAKTGFVAAFAPALVVAVSVAMIVGLLLVPALFAMFGSHMAWPRQTASIHERGRWAYRLVGGLERRWVAVTLVSISIALLVAVGSQARSTPMGFNIVTGLPADDEISIGAQDAARGFAAGILSPTLLVIDGERLDRRPSQLNEFAAAAASLDGVAGVLGPDVLRTTIERAGLGDEVARLELELFGPDETGSSDDAPSTDEPIRSADEVQATATRGVLVTSDGAHARLVLVLDADAYSGTASRALNELRPELARELAQAGLGDATLRIAGDTAVVERVVEQLDRDLLRIAAILIPFELLVLLLFLRSLRMAVVIVASSVVTTAAALGALAIFDRTLGAGDGVAFFVPVATFVLLLSIGADYGVLMGRALQRAGPGASVAAIRDTAPTIVLAGLVLASTFGLLAVVPLGAFTQFAVAMGMGVLLDTLLVRPLLMPLLLSTGTTPQENS